MLILSWELLTCCCAFVGITCAGCGVWDAASPGMGPPLTRKADRAMVVLHLLRAFGVAYCTLTATSFSNIGRGWTPLKKLKHKQQLAMKTRPNTVRTLTNEMSDCEHVWVADADWVNSSGFYFEKGSRCQLLCPASKAADGLVLSSMHAVWCAEPQSAAHLRLWRWRSDAVQPRVGA